MLQIIMMFCFGLMVQVLQLYALFCSGWMTLVSSHPDHVVDYSLWSQRICISGKCLDIYHSEARDLAYDFVGGFQYYQFIECQVETTLALVLCGIGLLISAYVLTSPPERDLENLPVASVVFMIISGILLLRAVSVFGLQHYYINSRLHQNGNTNGPNFLLPHGLILATMGGASAILCGISLHRYFSNYKLGQVTRERLVS